MYHTSNNMIEKEKMEGSFAANNQEMPLQLQQKAKMLCWKYNQTSPEQGKERKEILQ